MFRPIVAIAVLLFGLTLAAHARTPQHSELWNGPAINWRDARTGFSEASKTGRPVLMLFHATWCPSCKTYREVFKDPRIVEASKDFVMILVDVDTEKEVDRAFASYGAYVPRTLFIDSEGNVSNKLVGKDPQFSHSVDIESSGELLGLMTKARGLFKLPSPPVAAPGGGRT